MKRGLNKFCLVSAILSMPIAVILIIYLFSFGVSGVIFPTLVGILGFILSLLGRSHIVLRVICGLFAFVLVSGFIWSVAKYQRFKSSVDLATAIRVNDINLIKRKIREGYDVNGYADRGFTMLTRACHIEFHRGYQLFSSDLLARKRQDLKYRMLQVLLENGASVNKLDNHEGMAALHYIVRFGGNSYEDRSKLVQLLLSYGANVNLKTIKDKTPFQLAIKNGNTKIAEFLHQHGAKE